MAFGSRYEGKSLLQGSCTDGGKTSGKCKNSAQAQLSGQQPAHDSVHLEQHHHIPEVLQPADPVHQQDHLNLGAKQQHDLVPPPAYKVRKLLKDLPLHLREKWIVNPKLLSSNSKGPKLLVFCSQPKQWQLWGRGGIYRTTVNHLNHYP